MRLSVDEMRLLRQTKAHSGTLVDGIEALEVYANDDDEANGVQGAVLTRDNNNETRWSITYNKSLIKNVCAGDNPENVIIANSAEEVECELDRLYPATDKGPAWFDIDDLSNSKSGRFSTDFGYVCPDTNKRSYVVVSEDRPILIDLSVKKELKQSMHRKRGYANSEVELTDETTEKIVKTLSKAQAVGIRIVDSYSRTYRPSIYMGSLWKKGVVAVDQPYVGYTYWADRISWFKYSQIEATEKLEEAKANEKRLAATAKRKAAYQKRKEAGKVLLLNRYPRLSIMLTVIHDAGYEFDNIMKKSGIGRCHFIQERSQWNHEEKKYETSGYETSFHINKNLMHIAAYDSTAQFVPTACTMITVVTTMCLLKNDRYWFVNTKRGQDLIKESVSAFKIWKAKGPLKLDTNDKIAFFEGPYMKWIRKQKRLIPKARKAALAAEEEKQRMRLSRVAAKALKAAD